MRWTTTAGITRSVIGALVVAAAAAAPGPVVTAVSGRSWLHTLGVDYRDTSMGRGAGRYGPNPSDLAANRPALTVTLGANVTITGEDLYRTNCQACHRAEGTGAPPKSSRCCRSCRDRRCSRCAAQ
jgi:mono/diheme cytochrome c family protein